jgi:hypothetical protein
MTTTITNQQLQPSVTMDEGLHNGYVSTGRLLIQYRTRWVAVWPVCPSLAVAWRSLGVEWMERSDVVLTTRGIWASERWASVIP